MKADPVRYAVVLVGGFGTRLRPLTDDIPKPMLPVGHRPMIVGLVERLAAAGITDVVLALGFRPEPFADAFAGGRHGEVRIHYAVEPAPLDTGGAIAFAARHAGIDDTFVVANGDVITDAPLADLIACHREAGALATIELTPVDDPSAYGVVELDGTRVRRFVEKPRPGETESNRINAGTYVMEPAVLDRVPVGARMSVERDVFPALVADGQLAALVADDYWLDAGRPAEYRRANLDLISGARRESVDPVAPTAVVDPSADVDGSLVGAGARVGAGALIAGSVLLPGAFVGAGATVTDSIVAGTVGPAATVVDSLIGHGYVVGAAAAIAGARLPRPR